MAPAVIGVVVAIVSAVASVGTGIYSAVSSSQASDREESRAKRAAERARLLAAEKAEDFKRRAVAALGSERAARGASGVEMSGTPLLTYYENARNYERDIQRIREGGEVEATGWLERASEARAQGQGALIGGIGQTLLTGSTQVFNLGRQVGWWGNTPSQGVV